MEEQKNLSRPRKLEKNPTVPVLTQLEHSKNFTSSMNFFLIFNWEQLESEIILLSLRATLIFDTSVPSPAWKYGRLSNASR